MRFLSHLLRLLGLLLIFSFGMVFLILSLRLLSSEDVSNLLNGLYDSPKARFLSGGLGVAVLLATFALARAIVHQMQKERTIAFRNPDGDVTVALEAIEDFIKKIGGDLGGIKEIKPSITATRAGLLVSIRATLWADTHIPEATETLQSLVRNHMHGILGVEDPLTIQVHVGKVIQRPKHSSYESTTEEKIIER